MASTGGRESRIETMGLRKLLACLCTFTSFFESHAEVVVGLGVVGLEPNGLPQLGDAGVVLPLLVKGETQIIVGLGVVGLEPNGLPVLGNGGVVLTLGGKSETQVVVDAGGVGSGAG